MLCGQGELLIVKPMECRQKGAFMIRQPEYGSRNVNDSFYRFEGRMIEKMNAVLGDVALTRAEEKILIWLAGWEECTVNYIVAVIEKVARKRADEVGGYAHDKDECQSSSETEK